MKRTSHTLDRCTTHPRSILEKKWIRLPFLGKLTFQLSRILTSSGLHPAYHTSNILRNVFSVERPSPLRRKEWILWNFVQWLPSHLHLPNGSASWSTLEEHLSVICNYEPEISNFAKHILSSSLHSFHIESSISLLHSLPKGKKMTILENLEIIKNVNNHNSIVLNELIPPAPSITHQMYSDND